MGMLLFAQADIAPLMASLIGVPFPLNSVVRNTNVFLCYKNLFTVREEVLGTKLQVCEEKDYRFIRVIDVKTACGFIFMHVPSEYKLKSLYVLYQTFNWKGSWSFCNLQLYTLELDKTFL